MLSKSAAGSAEGRGLVVISGPSGVGKSSICQAILARLPGAAWSVSMTTRPKRPGETAGVNYHFVDEAEFTRHQQANGLLEWAAYCGHRYGTPRGPVAEALKAGHAVIMEIDVQGGIQIARKMPASTLIFVLPPTPASLRARLEQRNTESEADLARRLEQADGEIAIARDSAAYKHFVVNDDLEETITRILTIIERDRSA